MSDSNINDSNDKGRKNSEPDYQDVMKVEFAKLHKEYRTLENKRHAIAQREGYIHKRTDRIIPLLEQDHSELEHELQNALCKTHMRKADRKAKNMKDALSTFDMYQQEISKKIKQISEIEQHVDRITEKVVKQRFKMLALHGLSKTLAQRERDLIKAEDKLYHFTCAFNLQINENKKLRDEIMDFLIERKQFFKMHNSIKRQIAFAKKKMLNIVQLAIQTYDNRDEAMTKVKALREREAKEMKQHGMDVQEFDRTLHHDRSILEFIKMKLKQRPAFENARDRRIRVGSAKERELDAILKKYKRSFKQILAYSNSRSILDLVDKYHSMDMDNFEHFKFLTNLNNECEVLRGEVEKLKSNIEDAHTEVENRERKQRETQHRLQISIIGEHQKIDEMDRQHVENRHRNRDIFATIAAAMSLTNCNTAPILRLLGNNEGIDEHNVRLCLTQLDIKITEIKYERDRLRDIKSNNANVNTFKSVLGKSKIQPSQGGPFFPKVMMFHGESVDDEDTKIFEQEPYYYDEMKEYVFQKMVDDNMIDTVGRALSITSQRTKTSDSNPSSKPKLSDKVRQSLMETSSRTRRRRKEHLAEMESSAHEFADETELARKKTESIVSIGQRAQSELLKDHSKDKILGVKSESHPQLPIELVIDSPPPEEDIYAEEEIHLEMDMHQEAEDDHTEEEHHLEDVHPEE